MNRFFFLCGMCLGVFLCMLDTTVMNIALPAIQTDLNLSMEDLSWALNIYTILFAVLSIPLGRIAEIFGKHKMYMAALLLFGGASFIAGQANSLSMLIAGRGLQSVGAAIIFPMSMTIGIENTALAKRKNVIAALGVTQGLASALGPSIGGVLTEYFGWRAVFLVNLPLVLLCLLCCSLSLSFNSEQRVISKIDWPGSILSMFFLCMLTLALIKGNDWGWNSGRVAGLLVSSLCFFILFLFAESKAKAPMIQLRLFKNRQFAAASLVSLLSNLFLVAVTVILPTYFTKVAGKSELHAALLITPIMVMIFIFSPLAALLIDRLGPRLVIFAGFFAMAAGYAVFGWINPEHVSEVIVGCILLGIGFGMIAGPIMILAASDFKGEELTASQSIVGVVRQIGVVLAVAIFVSGLTSNLQEAQQSVSTYSVTAIESLHVTSGVKKKLLSETLKQIGGKKIAEGESAEGISQSEKEVTGKIQKMAKEQMTASFFDLYKTALPFIICACFSAFLFLKRKDYLAFIKASYGTMGKIK